MTSSFPEREDKWKDNKAEGEMELLMGIITGIRNIRSEADVHPSMKIEAFVICPDENQGALIDSYGHAVSDMTRLSSFTVQKMSEKPDDAATYILNDLEIYVPLKGLVDVESELAKLARERAKVEVKLRQVDGKLGNEKFLANAPESVVEKEKEKKKTLDSKLAKIGAAEERLGNMAR